VLCGVKALEASPIQCDLQVLSIALIPGPQRRTNSSVIGHTFSSDITVRDISFRTELTLFPIDVGRELPALDLSFHLHPSADAP
jgi:hypothetical protein